MPLHTLILNNIKNFPNTTCLLLPSRNLTYGEFGKIIIYFVSLLKTRINPKDIIIIEAEKNEYTYAAIIAVNLLRATYVPINKIMGENKIQDIISICQPKIILLQKNSSINHLSYTIKNTNITHIPDSIDYSSNISIIELLSLSMSIQDNDLLYIFFTSGSTGVSKGVQINHNNLMSYINNIQRIFTFSREDKFTQIAELTFDLSIHDIFLCFTTGGALCPIPYGNALLANRFVRDYKLTCWLSVPSSIEGILENINVKSEEFKSLKVIFLLGKALTNNLVSKITKFISNVKVINLYGPTEVTVACSAFDCSNIKSNTPIAPIGHPFNGVSFKIHNSELIISGNQVTPGYLNRDDLNKDRFLMIDGERYYKTGDKVTYSKKHGYYFHGRIDFQIKLRGYRVELEEVEALISGYLNSTVCCVPVVETASNNYRFLDLIVSQFINIEELTNNIFKKIPSYIFFRNIITTPVIPKNINGKVDRKACKILSLENQDTQSPYIL